MLYAVVEAVGSGGGGGGAVGVLNQGFTGGGGGSGGYTKSVVSAATIGASKTVIIGALGTGGAAGANNGTAGGDVCITTSTCVSGQIVAAKGGSGGAFAQSGSQSGKGGAGGVAGTGDLVAVGVPGYSGLYYAATMGSLVIGSPGQGASSIWGGGALSAEDVLGAADGINATGYGSGGSGGATRNVAANRPGGNGSAGAVFITEFVNQ
jgi:hypothetical protein